MGAAGPLLNVFNSNTTGLTDSYKRYRASFNFVLDEFQWKLSGNFPLSGRGASSIIFLNGNKEK
jgi:hypothetical protein